MRSLLPCLILAFGVTQACGEQRLDVSQLNILLIEAGVESSELKSAVGQMRAVESDRWGTLILGLVDAPQSVEALSGFPEQIRPSLALALAERAVFVGDYDTASAWLERAERPVTYAPGLALYLRLVVSHATVDYQLAREIAERIGPYADDFGVARKLVIGRIIEDLSGSLSESSDEDASLELATREMRESSRRLRGRHLDERLGRHQKRALELLDQKIEQLQQQQSQQQAQAMGSNGANGAPQQAANDSRPMEGKGEGLVAPRALQNGDPWGAIPPAERERLTQELQNKLPPGSRRLIQGYYKALSDVVLDEASEQE